MDAALVYMVFPEWVSWDVLGEGGGNPSRSQLESKESSWISFMVQQGDNYQFQDASIYYIISFYGL